MVPRNKRNVNRRTRLDLGKQEAILIYESVLEITARKPDGKVYVHKFTTKAPIYGLEDGSLLICSPDKRRLWGMFAVEDE